ncbi:MAG: serine/threonine protein kinase, partial [Myxococcota bacterium]|nr:serine/threonine protein kinase [Myxococcota bacterium]
MEHTFTGELLALKLMRSHLGASPDAIARFKREARAVSKIRSQHVVRIFDADVAPELGGVPYLVMDLLEGIDLEQLSAGRRIEPETVVEWLWQIALPLDKAHGVGIVHRDLKPENLFLTRRDDGRPLIKILDFGIAKITADSPSTTQSGLIFGTPLYMAPEQARADPAQVGPAADRYALGLIAYQLLTGSPYRTETSLTAVLSEIHNPLRAPSELGHSFGPPFDRWFLRACHTDPLQRFASAEEQIEALAQSLDVPLQNEAISGPSSVVGTRDSFAPESRRSQQDASWDALMSLRDAPVEKGTTSLEGRSRMLSSTVAAAPRGRARAARKRWRLPVLA